MMSRADMKLVPKDWDQFNPVLRLMGVGFVVVGGYPLLMMSGPMMVWLPRGIFGAFFVVGVIILVRQFQLWRRQNSK